MEASPSTHRGVFLNTRAAHGNRVAGHHLRVAETIYIALRGEGIDVWRPVEATSEGDSIYRISDAPAPSDEEWAFAPGSRVRCETRDLNDGPALIAVAAA
jgi:hypothetical protein